MAGTKVTGTLLETHDHDDDDDDDNDDGRRTMTMTSVITLRYKVREGVPNASTIIITHYTCRSRHRQVSAVEAGRCDKVSVS